MNRRELLYLALFASLAILLAGAVAAGAWYALPHQPEARLLLDLDDYPPAPAPTLIAGGDVWLAHTPAGELFAFVPIAPQYRDDISISECRYDWSSANSRFIDPCSGDEWELDGALNLRHSTELWSQRDLDRYEIGVHGERLTVYLDRLQEGSQWRVIYLLPDDLSAVAGFVRPERLAREGILPLRASTEWEEVAQAASRGLLQALIIHYEALDKVDADALATFFKTDDLFVAGIGIPGLQLAELLGSPALFRGVWPEDVETGTAHNTPYYFYLYSYQSSGHSATAESLLIDEGVATMLNIVRSHIQAEDEASTGEDDSAAWYFGG